MPQKKKTLTVTVGDKTFTRTTHRTYTHVLVGRRDRATALAHATKWTNADERVLRENFHHAQETADGSWWVKHVFEFRPSPEGTYGDSSIQAEGKRIVALGLDGYRTETQARNLERFREQDARGAFDTQVISWHGSLKNAQAALTTHRNRGFYSDLTIAEIPKAGS